MTRFVGLAYSPVFSYTINAASPFCQLVVPVLSGIQPSSFDFSMIKIDLVESSEPSGIVRGIGCG